MKKKHIYLFVMVVSALTTSASSSNEVRLGLHGIEFVSPIDEGKSAHDYLNENIANKGVREIMRYLSDQMILKSASVERQEFAPLNMGGQRGGKAWREAMAIKCSLFEYSLANQHVSSREREQHAFSYLISMINMDVVAAQKSKAWAILEEYHLKFGDLSGNLGCLEVYRKALSYSSLQQFRKDLELCKKSGADRSLLNVVSFHYFYTRGDTKSALVELDSLIKVYQSTREIKYTLFLRCSPYDTHKALIDVVYQMKMRCDLSFKEMMERLSRAPINNH